MLPCITHDLAKGNSGAPPQGQPEFSFASKLRLRIGPNMNIPASQHRRLSLLVASFTACFALCLTLGAPRAQAQTAATAAPRARVTQAVDDHQLVRLTGNVHPLAKPQSDKGAVDDAQPATRALILLQRSTEQEAALRQMLDDQQNPASANFHNWLTPAQFGAQFGPADPDVQAVTQWLTAHGFKNVNVGAGKTTIEFSGNVGQMREAFHTDIHKFLIRGEMRNANVSDPQIPAALSPVIAGVVGLSNFRPRAHIRSLGTFRKTKSTGEIKPLFTYPGGCGTTATSPCYAVGPGDFATIYNVPATVNGQNAGQGQTIVVVGDSNINISDANSYRASFGLPVNPPMVIVNGPDPGPSGPGGDEIEADLDTQIAGGVAPYAQVILVVTEQPDSGVGAAGVDLSVLYTVNNNLAPVVSKSFGLCEADEGTSGNALEAALWEQASAQGISGMVSAGDNGSAACDPTSNFPDVAVNGLAVSGDASTPFNVAVGGTDFNQIGIQTQFWNATNSGTGTSAKGYIPETTWNSSCAYTGSTTACTASIINSDTENDAGIDVAAGSGGQSNCAFMDNSGDCTGGYPKPSWQTGTGVPADGVRDLPDISLFASNGANGSFYVLCEADANIVNGSTSTSCDFNSPYEDFQGVGGTSASSPAFAAIMSLVVQKTGSRQGNPNYVLYPLAVANTCASTSTPASTCTFYDIPAQADSNNSVACVGGSPNCSNQSNSANQYGIMTTTNGGSTPAFNTTAGYDLATGLGSVNVTNLIKNWASATFHPTTTTFSLNGGAAVNITHGATVSVSGAVTSTSPGTPTGFVELFNPAIVPTQIIDTFPLSSNGSYSGMTNMLPGGAAYTVAARYGGGPASVASDGTFAASTSSTVEPVTDVSKEASQVSVNLVTFDQFGNPSFSSATSLAYGSPYILLVAVTNNSGNLCVPPPFGTAVPAFGAPLPCPTGNITLLDGGAALNNFLVPNTSTPTNTAKLNNSGFAEDQPIQLTGGSHSLTASYAGDSSFMASTSATRTLSVTTAATSISIASSASSITSGQSVTLTALVSSSSNSVTGPTGTVTFSAGLSTTGLSMVLGSPVTCTPAAATATAGASCTATLTTTALTMLTPPPTTWQIPRVYFAPLLATMLVLLTILLWMLPRVPANRRRAYVYAMAVLFACAAAGIAGCGGGGGGGGGGSNHTYVIHGAYNGDTNYAASNSTGIQIIVQ
jgi:Pro-kumamolisin, activation domain/Bacterial Ig-like domain (group 3)